MQVANIPATRKIIPIAHRREVKNQSDGYLRISIDVTRSCQLNCKYCYFGDKSSEDVNVEKVMSAVKNLVSSSDEKLNRVRASYMGGEPTVAWSRVKELNSKLRCMLSDMGMAFTWGMTSNLVDLDQEKTDYMIAEGANVLCSIDGPRDIHNKNRPFAIDGRDSYDDVVGHVAFALKVSKRKKARATLYAEDSDRIPEIAETIFNLGFKEVGILPNAHEHWSPKQIKNWGVGMAKTIDMFDSSTSLVSTIITREGCDFDQALGIKSCGICENMFALSTKGDLYPCHRLTQLPQFSMIDASSSDTTAIKEAMKLSLQEFSIDAISECRSCIVRYRCGGGCLADNAAVNGDPRLPVTTLCKLKRAVLNSLSHMGIAYKNRDHSYSTTWCPINMFSCATDCPNDCDSCCDSGSCYGDSCD